jgi:transposase
MEYQRVEVITGTPRRRRYSAEEKAAAVMESMAPGASIADVARRRGICRSLLFRWRQLAQASAAGPAFVPMMLEAPTAAPEASAPSSAMEIVLCDGRSLRSPAS